MPLQQLVSLRHPGSSEYVVEVEYDHEVGMWFYTVDKLNIIGTGCPSKEAAERYAQVDRVRSGGVRRSAVSKPLANRRFGATPRKGKGPVTRAFVVAGAGFEPATSGL